MVKYSQEIWLDIQIVQNNNVWNGSYYQMDLFK